MGPRLLIAALIAAPAWADMQLVMLPTDKYNATCSDGTPVGYHIQPAPSGSANKEKWTIWMKGGASCSSYEDCVRRQSCPPHRCTPPLVDPGLGSSKNWNKTMKGAAIQNTNKAENPDFWDWTHVYLVYCSGDLWSGKQLEPVNPWPNSGPKKFAFAGFLHLVQVIDHLMEERGAPKEMILTGDSAGGIGTYMNADYVASLLPATTKFRAMPQGGFFGQPSVDYAHFKPNKTTDPDPGGLTAGGWFGNITRHVSEAEQRCVAANPSLGLSCGMPFRAYPYTTTPMFSVQASVDYEQVFEYTGAPQREVFSNPKVAAYVKYQHGVQTGNLEGTVVRGPKSATDGVFAPACLGHWALEMGWLGTERVWAGFGYRGQAGQNPRVDGMWTAQAFGDWYFERGAAGSHMHLDDNDDLTTLCSCNRKVCYPKNESIARPFA